MTKVSDIVEFLENKYSPELAEGFDNVGLLIGRKNREVKKAMIMLDCDEETLKEAILFNADMIITHHPVLFSSIKKITNDLYLDIIENKIALFSAHTNLDTAVNGVNDCLAKILKLKNIAQLPLNNADNLMARTGELDTPLSLIKFIEYVKKSLQINNLRYVGKEDTIIKKVGVISGSAVEFMNDIQNAGCDVLVTADIKYHEAQRANANHFCIIDAGHFETENIVCKELYNILNNRFKDIEFAISARKNSYIKYG